MKYCKFLNRCTCCMCGKKIKGPGYVFSRNYSPQWEKDSLGFEHLVLDRPVMPWQFNRPEKEHIGKTTCLKCVERINRRQKKVERLALKSFYNDPDAIKMLERKIKANKRRPKVIAKIRRGLYAISPVMAKWQAAQPKIDIEALKQIPIGEIMPDPAKRKYGHKEFYLCPLPSHSEKTPSFQWDKKTNKFYCFGCQKHGSVIDLHMELNNVDFKTAINQLNKM